MSSGRRLPVALAVITAVVFLSGLLALTGRAQAAPSGRQVALGLEAVCPDKTQTRVAADFDRREVLGRWVTVAGPTFGLKPDDPRPGLTAHAVDAGDPRRLFATEGHAIARSLDGGCTWDEVHFVPPVPAGDVTADYATGSIIQLAVSGTGSTSRVWAMWAPEANTLGAIRMFVSDDGGDTWQERSDGLPAAYHKATDVNSPVIGVQLDCGSAGCQSSESLAVAPSDRDVAYVGLRGNVSTGPFFRSTDGGRTWVTGRAPRGVGCCSLGITDVVVDPEDARSVWIVETGGLLHSPDGGQSFAYVEFSPDANASAAGLHLSRDAGPELNVSVLLRYRGDDEGGPRLASVARSSDGGKTFTADELEEPISGTPALAQGGDPAQILLATSVPDQVLEYRAARGGAVSLAVPNLGKLDDPMRDRTGEPATWLRGYTELAAFVPGPLPGNRFPPRPRFDPVAARLADRPPVPGELNPRALDRDLGVEGSETVDYRLDLPALPTPVDIWFLVDTSGSMAGAHRGLQTGIRDIVAKLDALGMDAWYGLGVFPDGPTIPYGRYADIGPPGGELYAALDRLGTTGGGNELHPTALYQTVTGAGQPDAGLSEGLGASFRPEALKIIIHASDEPYGYDPSGPTQEEAAEALVAAKVRHVGLDLTDGATLPGAGEIVSSLRADHDEMATATETFAPPGGIDCNGDGLKELEEGDPITCPINRLTDTVDIAPTIVAAVSAIRDETGVALTVVDAGGIDVQIGDPTRSPVNVKVPNSLPFAVRYTCPAHMVNQVGDVRLRATVRGAPSAEAVARIGCGTPQPALVAPPPRPAPPPPVVPMIIAPPQLVPDLEPAVGPLNQTAPAQVAQPTPQPGIAAQPGEAATAKQRAGRDGPPPAPGAETGDRRDTAPAPNANGTLAAGAALSLALGALAIRRERAPGAAVTAGR